MALTFEQAKKIAKDFNWSLNVCYEYDNAYRFMNSRSDVEGYAGIVVLKRDGTTMHYAVFVLSGLSKGIPKKIQLLSKRADITRKQTITD